ncbi:MAG: SH3 domain-containing protein [Spartobacteria bacterium]|nr:SH3 domain-containing protein [Spartobacteria bacterium]
MKRQTCILMLVLSASMMGTAHAREMSVQVREGVLRSTPSFLGAVTAKVTYGDRVELMEKENGWAKVRTGAVDGWIHESALTAKRLTLSAGGQTVSTGASSDELALAGKGFNAEVEAEFKAQNQEADFSEVDRMEAIAITEPEMQRFLQKGGVMPPEGGAL